MKKKLSIFLCGVLMVGFSSAQKKQMKYFDEDYVQIPKKEFKKRRATFNYLDLPGNSPDERKLVYRENAGQINSRPALQALLEKELNLQLDAEKPLVIIFHPGKDRCNSTGSSTPEDIRFRYLQLEKAVMETAQTKPIYIYKNKSELKTSSVNTWYQDPKATIEKLFFKEHYPCGSFVVISKNGDFISYFGEYSYSQVPEALQNLAK
ncbi:hypothetical protein OA84_10495 [Kaistella solincola]|uniref:Uncharacterized protein n=1 Tax=Kaistella solincola TaxID=510955 RepID=A0ABR4ZNC0_9FLAO|nr:hypothetical protein [Kaistella solincola]KIA82581.1 hypothetical protein OA84_10495 [Kaistella solincola]